ncbi:hypothetical protein Anapl_09129 [Anas platyrhynchos]|uniref:Uncharacterized protein n=1 Tax=Anas platyrhynchos TaxID=8839 RepID=R0JQ07_ANAPL|nr:hypothetical protein Anapl_09129 [Anas platyrhynchos]
MAARQICFASAGPFFLCAHAVVSRELQEGARLHPGELLAGLSTDWSDVCRREIGQECRGLPFRKNQSLRARTKCADTSVSGVFCLKTPHLAKQVPSTISLLFSVLPATAVACSCSELPAEDACAYGGAACHPVVGVGSVGSGAQPQDGCLYGQVEGTCQRSLPAVLGKGEAAPQERGDGFPVPLTGAHRRSHAAQRRCCTVRYGARSL